MVLKLREVVKHNPDKIDLGFGGVAAKDQHEYNTNKLMPKQEWKWNRHTNERCGARADRFVPPINTGVPVELFHVNMKFEKFLLIWSENANCLEILAREMKEEVLWLFRNNPVNGGKNEKDHLWFAGISVQWFSWSAMLMMEYCYPDIMCKCTSFQQCIIHMVEHIMDNRFKTGTKKAKGLQFLSDIFAPLNRIQLAIWDSHNVIYAANSGKRFRYKVFDTINDSKWWLHVFGEKKTTGPERKKFLIDSALQNNKLAVGLVLDASRERQKKALTAPTPIHELDFVTGVRKLVELVYGEDLNVHKKVVLTSKQHCAAGLCLVQLLCGSRSKGVIGANWFDKVRHTLDDEYKEQSIITREQAKTMYSGIDYCVTVKRITKEKDKDVREYERRAALAHSLDKEIEDVPHSANKVADYTIIIKPILFMLLDKRYLDRARFNNDETLEPLSAVDVFLRLVTTCREFVKKSAKKKSVEFMESPFKDFPMWGYTDAETYQLSGAHSRDFNNNWNKEMNVVVKSVFSTFIKKGQGTHMLRRLYVNRGYDHFSSNKMKETAFTRLTLGHKGYEVSLYYTSLIFMPAINIDKKRSLDVQVRESLVETQVRLLLLEKRLERTSIYSVPFETTDGKEVLIDRLRRADRRTSTDVHAHRGIGVIKKLREKDVKITWIKLYKLGVSKEKAVRAAIKAHPEYIPFSEKDM